MDSKTSVTSHVAGHPHVPDPSDSPVRFTAALHTWLEQYNQTVMLRSSQNNVLRPQYEDVVNLLCASRFPLPLMPATEQIERTPSIRHILASLQERCPLPPIIMGGLFLCVLLMTLAVLKGLSL